MTPIDLDKIKEAAVKAYAEACDLRSGSTRYMDELSEFTCDPELIVQLVAVVEAARDYILEFDNPVPDYSLRSAYRVDLRAALHPFSHINGGSADGD